MMATLKQQQHDDDHRAAEHDIQQAALAAAQQTDLIIVLKPNLAHKRTSFVQSFRCGSARSGCLSIIAEIPKTFKAFRRFSGAAQKETRAAERSSTAGGRFQVSLCAASGGVTGR